jgi:DNA sulfur modification protein DndD
VKLLWLRLKDFRQFEGQVPKIEFSTDKRRNVTVIHGGNGSGKTAVLNALTWLFYRSFTDALALPDQLVNLSSIAQAKPNQLVTGSVELQFEHDASIYHLSRNSVVRRGDDPKSWSPVGEDMSLEYAGPDGHWIAVQQPQEIEEILNRILPKELHSYFLFDGERIERLQRPDKRAEIVSAATMLCGEVLLNRSLKDLNAAEKRLETEFYNLVKDRLYHDFAAEKQALEQQLQEASERQASYDANLAGLRVAREAVDNDLRKLKSVADLQATRDQLATEEQNLQEALAARRLELADLLSARGYQAYLSPAADSFVELVGDLRSRGELPSAMKTPFVRALLDSGRCICDRVLEPGSPPYAKVESWMALAGLSEIEETAYRTEAIVEHLSQDLPDLFARMATVQDQRRFVRERKSKVEGELERIREELKGSPEADVRGLQDRLDTIDSQMGDIRLQLADNARGGKRLEAEIKAKQQLLDSQQALDSREQTAKARLDVCRQACRFLDQYREDKREEYRLDLGEKVNRLFGEMSFKPYYAALEKDYTLSLRDAPGGSQVGLSTGESQVLSLAFIGAVMEQARKYAPFGSLDGLNRHQVATHLPEIADQVILLVTRTQWEGEVEKALDGRIGGEYVLSYSTPKPDAREDALVRKGTTYSLVKKTASEYESTEVVEVKDTSGKTRQDSEG